MPDHQLMHLHPTLEILAEALSHSGISCSLIADPQNRQFRAARLFTGEPCREDVLYLLRPEDAPRFPADRCGWLCAEPLNGCGILCPDGDMPRILTCLSDIFLAFQDMELAMDDLLHRGADPRELCELGAELLDNPICIHDDWFIITAMSSDLPQIMSGELVQSSNRMFIPREIVEEFRYDEEYTETYSHRTTQLWENQPNTPKCLYVNLWSGNVYRGRLLVMEHHRGFRRADYLIAQNLAQRAAQLIQLRRPGDDPVYRSMDDVVFDLLSGEGLDSADESLLLDTLCWGKQDKLVCLCLQNQTDRTTLILEHVLHSDLFRTFPNSYILFEGNRQCVIANITKSGATLLEIRHLLSPLCRDYCLYGGISSPVLGLGELSIAYRQADIALGQAFRLQNERWVIPFSDCALEYLLGTVQTPLPYLQLTSPELRLLMEQDAQNGTQYFHTLKTYLMLERDIPKTAEKLIIHRTTLLYRLKKILSITGLTLDDPWKRLYLLFSLWILEKEQLRTDL